MVYTGTSSASLDFCKVSANSCIYQEKIECFYYPFHITSQLKHDWEDLFVQFSHRTLREDNKKNGVHIKRDFAEMSPARVTPPTSLVPRLSLLLFILYVCKYELHV